MAKFSEDERKLISCFVIGDEVNFQGKSYEIIKAGKPKSKDGEPKTDLYLLLRNNSEQLEIKISYKKSNADFLENKIKAERAESVFGTQWKDIIQKATEQLKDQFLAKPLIFKKSFKRTERGAITLGWKFELMNKISGELSEKIPLTKEQCFDIYSGNNLPEDKRNASVNNEEIRNSGVADYIFVGDEFESADAILAKICPISDYVEKFPEIYFACKALNYRTFKNKWDGDRPLSVQVSWNIENGKLTPELIFNKPLQWNGNSVAKQLKECLSQLNINDTDDINDNNAEQFCVYK